MDGLLYFVIIYQTACITQGGRCIMVWRPPSLKKMGGGISWCGTFCKKKTNMLYPHMCRQHLRLIIRDLKHTHPLLGTLHTRGYFNTHTRRDAEYIFIVFVWYGIHVIYCWYVKHIFENVKGLLRKSFSEYFQYVILQLTYPALTKNNDECWEGHLYRLEEIHSDGKYTGLKYNVVFISTFPCLMPMFIF